MVGPWDRLRAPGRHFEGSGILEGVLGPLWEVMGSNGTNSLEPYWDANAGNPVLKAVLQFRNIWGEGGSPDAPGGLLGASRGLFEASWGLLEAPWALFEASLGLFDASWGHSDSSWPSSSRLESI